MRFSFQKKSKKKLFLLLFILFFHVISIVISAYYDRGLHWNHREIVKFSELRYWLGFFTGWSAGTSLLTICGVIYKLFFAKKQSGYREQVFDLMIAEINLISGVVFCLGGFLLTGPGGGRPSIPFPLLKLVNPVFIGIINNFFGHVLAPALSFCFFGKYCQIDKLVKKRSLTTVVNLLNPTIYFFYVLTRPEIKVINYTAKLRGNQAYHYPANYPYPYFFGGMGKFSGELEKKNQNSSGFFWHSGPPGLQKTFFLPLIILLKCLIFWLLFHYLIKFKTSKNK